MAFTKNNVSNVSGAKGADGGYCFFAPAGTELPTDYSTELPAAFKNLGFVADEGIVFSTENETTTHKDINGVVADTSLDSVEKTATLTLMEVKRDALAVKFGEANVTDENGMLTVHDKGEMGERGVMVLELLLKNGRKLRRVIPDVQFTELGDETVLSSELFAVESTLTLYKDATIGDYKMDYMESTETEAN